MGELIQDLKHSLVDPEGDFVQMIPLNNADTVIITEDDLNDIRGAYTEEEPEDDYGYDEDGYSDDDYEDDYEDREEYDRDSDEMNPGMNKVIKVLTIVVALLILIVLGVVVGRASGVLKFGKGTEAVDSEGRLKVPSVVGKKEGEAKEILEEAGFKCKVKARRQSKKYEEGCVIEQSPEEGKRAKKGAEVEIVVSSGRTAEEEIIPDVAGMDEAAAQKMLNDKGFSKVTTEAVYSEETQGTVIGTDPAAGTKTAKTTEIKMKVSKGSEKITVPNVVGMSENDAKNAIVNAGLQVSSVDTEYNENYEAGLVTRQEPSGGKVEKGTSVSLTVSLGKKPEEKPKVPSVAGTSESNANQMIINAGLTPSSTVTYQASDSVPAGCVISCSPAAGTEVAKGSTVSLVVSTGAPATPEPPVSQPDDDTQGEVQ